MHKDAFIFGQYLAELEQGVPHGTAVKCASTDATLDATDPIDTRFWNKFAHGYLVFAEAGDSPAAALFKIASIQSDNELAQALARVSYDTFLTADNTKEAGQLAGVGGRVAAPLVTRLATLSPAVVQTILLGAVGGGSALGAGMYTLKRHTERDDTDIETMKQRIANYNNLSRELQANALNRSKAFA